MLHFRSLHRISAIVCHLHFWAGVIINNETSKPFDIWTYCSMYVDCYVTWYSGKQIRGSTKGKIEKRVYISVNMSIEIPLYIVHFLNV